MLTPFTRTVSSLGGAKVFPLAGAVLNGASPKNFPLENGLKFRFPKKFLSGIWAKILSVRRRWKNERKETEYDRYNRIQSPPLL